MHKQKLGKALLGKERIPVYILNFSTLAIRRKQQQKLKGNSDLITRLKIEYRLGIGSLLIYGVDKRRTRVVLRRQRSIGDEQQQNDKQITLFRRWKSTTGTKEGKEAKGKTFGSVNIITETYCKFCKGLGKEKATTFSFDRDQTHFGCFWRRGRDITRV